MKLLGWILLVAMATGAQGGATKEERVLVGFYRKHYPKHEYSVADLSTLARSTEKYARLLCLQGELDTLLALAHREAQCRKDRLGDDGKSFGAYQTLLDDMEEFRGFWKRRGIKLRPVMDLDTQCAFGVAEFYKKLLVSRGNVWGAVRRYNGSGPMAQRHARKVFVSRRVIFGRPHVEGERIRVGCE